MIRQENNVKGGTLPPRLVRTTAEGKADGQACLEAALQYRELGWPVLPCCPPDHLGIGRRHGQGCGHPGKAPLVRWKEFQDGPPPTEQQALDWWSVWPNANVGLALGRLLRIDVDGPAGEELLQRLSKGDLPGTLEFTSGRANGGRGLLYAAPHGLVLQTSIEGHGIGEKQELRLQGLGAQTVLPPSRHISGSRYYWVAGHSPNEMRVALAPVWLVEALLAKAPGGRQCWRAPVLGDAEKIEEGRRDTMLASLAGTMRRRGMSEAAILAALTVENESRCEPPLDDEQVRKIAHSYAGYAPGKVPILVKKVVVCGSQARAATGKKRPSRKHVTYIRFNVEVESDGE